jgi:hypothetical protein
VPRGILQLLEAKAILKKCLIFLLIDLVLMNNDVPRGTLKLLEAKAILKKLLIFNLNALF